MGRFSASLKTMGDPRGLPATVELDEGRLSIVAGEADIGEWPLSEIGLERTPNGYRLAAEGEQLLIELAEPDRFAEALAESTKKKGLLNGLLPRRGKRSSDDPETPSHEVTEPSGTVSPTREEVAEPSDTREEVAEPSDTREEVAEPSESPAAAEVSEPGTEGPERAPDETSSSVPPSLIDAMRERLGPPAEPSTEETPAEDVEADETPIEPRPRAPQPTAPEPVAHATEPSEAPPAGDRSRESPSQRRGVLPALVDKLDRTIDVTEKRWGPLLPNWVFNRIVFVMAGVLAILALVFRGVTSLVFLIAGVLALMIGGAAYIDDVMASKLLPGRTTPTHVLLAGLGSLAVGIIFGLLA